MLKLLQHRVIVISALVALFVTVHVINSLLDGALLQYGIFPRDVGRLTHIASAPFLHGNWEHLVNNLWAFVIFSVFALLRPMRFYFGASLFIIIFSGLCVWLFGRTSYHIGASGWIYGLWSLSIATAWFDRNLKSIAIGAVVIVLYGGMAIGVFSLKQQVSFEGHVSGAIGGVLFAYLYQRFSASTLISRRS